MMLAWKEAAVHRTAEWFVGFGKGNTPQCVLMLHHITPQILWILSVEVWFFCSKRSSFREEVDSSELWILVINGFKWALNAIMFLSCVILNSGLGAAWGSRGLWCCVCQRLPELRDSPSECTAVLLGNRTHQDMEKGNDTSGLRFVSSPWNIANLHQWEALYLKGWYYNPFASFSAELKFPARRGFTEPRVQQLKEDFKATFDSSKHG